VPGPHSSLMVLPGRAGQEEEGKWRTTHKQTRPTPALCRLLHVHVVVTSKQIQSHAPRRGACDCQARIRQLVVSTPGRCPSQPAQIKEREKTDNLKPDLATTDSRGAF